MHGQALENDLPVLSQLETRGPKGPPRPGETSSTLLSGLIDIRFATRASGAAEHADSTGLLLIYQLAAAPITDSLTTPLVSLLWFWHNFLAEARAPRKSPPLTFKAAP